MGTLATVRLIEGIRLIRCPLNTGFTVYSKKALWHIVRYVFFFVFSGNKTECVEHRTIDDDSRSHRYSASDNNKNDRYLPEGWYRFVTRTRMNTKCVTSGNNYCNTAYIGYLSQNHPSVEEGIVTRQVCFSYPSYCCRYSTYIKVLNCGSFYVYKLKPTPVSWARYCTE